jgi:hypothetical protein
VGDVAVGLLASAVALTAFRNRRTEARRVSWWNVLGVADPIIAVSTGFLTSRSALQDSPNEVVTVFPMVLIPTFLVPLSTLLHIMSLIKLKRTAASLQTSGYAHRGSPIP